MPRYTTTQEARDRFHQEWKEHLDSCAKKRYSEIKHDPTCLGIIAAARRQLGYAASTAAVDVYTAVMRGYRRSLQQKPPARDPGGGIDPDPRPAST